MPDGFLQRNARPMALAVLFGVVGLTSGPARAVPSLFRSDNLPSAPLTPPANPAKDGLEPAPLTFEPLGMRFRPPAGSIMRSEGSGKSATWVISEKADPPRFILRVSKLYAQEATSTPAAQIDAYVKAVSERPSPNAVFSVRSRQEFELGGRPAALLYTSLREGEGEDEVSAVQGYFILQVAPNEFVVVSSLLADADYAGTHPILERSFRTMEILDPESIAAARAARMGRGEHLLDGLDEEALRRALDPVGKDGALPPPRWYRISRVDPNGEVAEVGYMTVTAIDAVQGAANPDRTEKEWTKEERERGLLVRVQLRTLLDATGTSVSDTDARYWVRWDRAREFWTVRSTARKGRTTRTSAQLGIRNAPSAGTPRPMLEVTEVSQSEAAAEPRRWTVPDRGYLSQAESFVLSRLLPRATGPTDYGFYWFETRSGRLTQRADLQTPRADGFELATKRTLEAPALEDLCDARGILRRRTGDDGSLVEATTGPALLELWRSKGLPTQ